MEQRRPESPGPVAGEPAAGTAGGPVAGERPGRAEALALADVGRAITESLDPEAVHQRIVESVRGLLDTEMAVLYRVDPATEDLYLVAGTGPRVDWNRVLRRGTATVGVAVRERRPVSTPDLLADPRVSLTPEARARIERSGYRAVLAVPLLAHGRVIGALAVGDAAGRTFGAEAARLLETFAAQAATAMENARLYSEERAARTEAETLASLAAELNTSLDLDRVLRAVAEAARRLCRSDLARIALREPDGPAMVYRYLVGTRLEGYDRLRLLPGKGFVGRVLETGRPFRTADALADPAVHPEYGPHFIRGEGIRTVMVVPVRTEARVEGLIYVARRSEQPFTDADEDTCSRLAHHAAVAIRNAGLLQQERQARERAETAERRWRVLSETARAVTASLDVDTVLQRILHGARDLCASDAAAIFLREAGGATLVPRYRTGTWPEAYRNFRVEPGRGAGGRVLLTGRPFRTADYLNDPALPDAHRDIARDTATVALMVVPIVIEGRVEGLLYLSNRTPRPFSGEDEAVSFVLAEQAAIALRNSGLYAAERAARADAEAASRAKDQFLAMLAHELRNPLSAIVNAVAVLEHAGGQPDQAARARTIIRRQTDHLTRLLDDLLDVARLTRGFIDLRLTRLDLRAAVELGLEAQRHRLEAKRHHLAVALPEGPVLVTGDVARLQQVVANLLDNAAKYTPAGGTIRVTLAVEGDEGVLRVRDTGIGIPPERLEAIFELFTQVDPTLARLEGGLGVGLTLVKRLVEMHGGTVRACSEGRGAGAEFVVRLPLAPADRVAAGRPPAGTAPGPSRRVLVIEDNDDAREALAAALRLFGHRVREAASGGEGLAAALTDTPEVVLVDIGLPDMEGFEVGRRLRQELGPAIRLVALTGYGQPEDRRRSAEAGFDAHLVKPVAADDILGVLAAT